MPPGGGAAYRCLPRSAASRAVAACGSVAWQGLRPWLPGSGAEPQVREGAGRGTARRRRQAPPGTPTAGARRGAGSPDAGAR
ncbi:hypothetical protein FGK60_31470 [Streptomyces sp. DASNCL29]|nr:hypothetical protein FGK60_31470 [Streptomyces sp. DASNCL29]